MAFKTHSDTDKLGYAWLKDHLGLEDVVLDSISLCANIASFNKEDERCHYYPASYRPKSNSVMAHLIFALKNEGLNLFCLTRIFRQDTLKSEIEQALRLNPVSKYNRLLGFYFEMLSGQFLDTPVLLTRNYINAVDENIYYVTVPVREKKFRINNNFVGNGQLSALVRRNDEVLGDGELSRLVKQPVPGYSIERLEQVARYLISVEVRASNDIEAEVLSPNKHFKFMAALETITHEALTPQKLIDTLNLIKDKQDQEFDYRYQQNYLAKRGRGYATVDYIPPKPADAHCLMAQWFNLRGKVLNSAMPAIAKAAVLSSSFVYIHPFMDGNGRISRYIMQDTLYRTQIIDRQHSLPLSLGLLKSLHDYYAVLNRISRRIMTGVKFDWHDNHSVSVMNETIDLYRHLCFDQHVIYLSDVAKKVGDRLMPEKIEERRRFDLLIGELDAVLDLPGKELGWVANLLMDNTGKISHKKRKGILQHIHPETLDCAEKIYASLWGDDRENHETEGRP